MFKAIRSSLMGGDFRRGMAVGRLTLLAGLAAWVSVSLKNLPYCYLDIHYLFSVELGLWGPHEWVHPLFTPLLGALRSAMLPLGHSGKMLMPLEYVNVAIGVATLSLLYAAAERLRWDPFASALGVLCLGFSSGFWQGALRPDPYSAGALCSAATLAFLMGRFPADHGKRYAWAGIAAGLTCGFHSSGLSLLPVAAAAAWLEEGATRKGVRLFLRFLGRALIVIALIYAVFALSKGIGPDYFARSSFKETFHKIEQMPGSSIYTGGDPLKQVKDYIHTVKSHGGMPLAALIAFLFAAGLIVGRGRIACDALQRNAAFIAGANAAFYALFFIINNSQNGFVYAGLLSVPFLMAFPVGRSRALSLLMVPAVLAVSVLAPRHTLILGPQNDPLFIETRFLNGLLRPGDVLIVPGCPFPEITYERRLNILQVADPEASYNSCLVPAAAPEDLPRRISETLKRGGRVYIHAAGSSGDPTESARDKGGAEKRIHIFFSLSPGALGNSRRMRGFWRKLKKSLAVKCDVRSPQGWRYCRLGLKPGAEPEAADDVAAFRSVGVEEFRAFNTWMTASQAGPLFMRRRMRYLLDWLEESPEDPYVKHDIFSTLSAYLQRPRVKGMPEEAAARFVENLKKMRGALNEVKLSCAELKKAGGGRAPEHLHRAMKTCPVCFGPDFVEPSSAQFTPRGAEALCRRFTEHNLLNR